MLVGVSSANRKPPLVCKRNLPKDRSAIPTDRGSSAQLAAFASSLFGVGLFMGRVSCGYLLDQFLAPRVAALLFSAVAIGIAFLGLGHAIWSACIAAVLVGLGIAAEVDIIAYLTSRYSGLRPYGAIFGWIWAAKGHSSCFAFFRVRDQVEFFGLRNLPRQLPWSACSDLWPLAFEKSTPKTLRLPLRGIKKTA